MTKASTKTYLIGVIERAISYYKVEAEDARTAAEDWHEGQFWDRDEEALDSEGPCSVREQQPDGTFLKLPRSQWQAGPTAGSLHGKNPFSVLLLYPDYANDSGTETYYAFVEAKDPIKAVTLAQQKAATIREGVEMEPDDFVPLLVTQGHHASEPLFNK
jgi:hypothetical protein